MQTIGFLGNDGHIINNVTVSATLPTGNVGVALGILNTLYVKVLSLQLIIRSLIGAFTANWLVEGSNNYAPPSGGGSFGQPPNAGDWTDITATFVSNAITVAITANGTQMVQSPVAGCGWRDIRVSATRTGGTSAVVDVWACGKGA